MLSQCGATGGSSCLTCSTTASLCIYVQMYSNLSSDYRYVRQYSEQPEEDTPDSVCVLVWSKMGQRWYSKVWEVRGTAFDSPQLLAGRGSSLTRLLFASIQLWQVSTPRFRWFLALPTPSSWAMDSDSWDCWGSPMESLPPCSRVRKTGGGDGGSSPGWELNQMAAPQPMQANPQKLPTGPLRGHCASQATAEHRRAYAFSCRGDIECLIAQSQGLACMTCVWYQSVWHKIWSPLIEPFDTNDQLTPVRQTNNSHLPVSQLVLYDISSRWLTHYRLSG